MCFNARVDPTAQDSEEEDAVNIWPYFNTSCFEGFRDGDSKSFWTVYQEAFDLVTEHVCPSFVSLKHAIPPTSQKPWCFYYR